MLPDLILGLPGKVPQNGEQENNRKFGLGWETRRVKLGRWQDQAPSEIRGGALLVS